MVSFSFFVFLIVLLLTIFFYFSFFFPAIRLFHTEASSFEIGSRYEKKYITNMGERFFFFPFFFLFSLVLILSSGSKVWNIWSQNQNLNFFQIMLMSFGRFISLYNSPHFLPLTKSFPSLPSLSIRYSSSLPSVKQKPSPSGVGWMN